MLQRPVGLATPHTHMTTAPSLHISENWSFCYKDVGDVDCICSSTSSAADTAAAVRGKQMRQQQLRAVHDNWRSAPQRRWRREVVDNDNNNFTDRVAFTLCWQCWMGLKLCCGGCQR